MPFYLCLMELHNIIRKEREKQGISRYKLSKAIDTGPTNLKKIEDGTHSPSFGMICKICTELGMSIMIAPNKKVKAL